MQAETTFYVLSRTQLIPVNCFKLLHACIINTVILIVRNSWISENIHSTCFWITPAGHRKHLKLLKKKSWYFQISVLATRHISRNLLHCFFCLFVCTELSGNRVLLKVAKICTVNKVPYPGVDTDSTLLRKNVLACKCRTN